MWLCCNFGIVSVLKKSKTACSTARHCCCNDTFCFRQFIKAALICGAQVNRQFRSNHCQARLYCQRFKMDNGPPNPLPDFLLECAKLLKTSLVDSGYSWIDQKHSSRFLADHVASKRLANIGNTLATHSARQTGTSAPSFSQ